MSIDRKLKQMRSDESIVHRAADTWPRHRAKARRQRAMRQRYGRSDPATRGGGRQ